ncbi:MAG: enoyl-CoA hydratase [Burkholderiales bacterium]|nr:enoyl-CoA hydratase [Burkholderiales bacterium]MDE2290318.1 enoyl-CoA hydratase [Burkholderiales bacterium]MDE2609885.1 enoyl-CoA hydratase [Burkholderiales bacterium]
MSAELLAERVDQTLVLTLSNPGARNALHPSMYAAGIEAIVTAERDASVRAIVLTGADNFFCAGGNLNRLLENRAKDKSVQAESINRLAEWVEAIRTCPKPVICAVEGAAAGAGFSLALACDLLVAADNAKFVMAYAKVALTPDGGGSWFLSTALPRQLATEILLEGKTIDAQRMAGAGLVNRVVKPGEARDAALAWAEQLSQLSPHALGRIKALIEAGPANTLRQQLELERDNFIEALHHRDGLEGISAFLEKRPAQYK